MSESQPRPALSAEQETMPPAPAVDPAPEPPGQLPVELPQVPGYELLGVLGQGGMGVVYKARHLRLNRVVALKVVLSGAHASAQELLRFRVETEALASLQHPNVVQVFDSGQHQGLPFCALEFVSGGSLADRLDEGPLPAKEAARLVEQVAQGVQAAHAKGIVHRDLTPGNVLLAPARGGREPPEVVSASGGSRPPLAEWVPKVTDFGLAKRVEAGTGLTQTGAIMGTPSYMAPEQAQGESKRVGPAADTWALGALLYESLTGRPPFKAATPLDTLLQVLDAEPAAVRQLQPNCPRDLETICHKCLQKDPAKRYASAQAFADDLRRFQNGEPITARPVGSWERGWRWCRRNPVVATLLAAVMVLTVLGTGLVTWQWRSAVAALARAENEQKQRALAQVNALIDAVPEAVPAILTGLEREREVVLPRLRELWAESGDESQRMRLALALLPVEPDAVRDDLAAWLLKADDPAEVLLVRNVLLPHKEELKERFWSKADDATVPATERFRALVALAAFDPESERWAKAGANAVGEMLSANPLHLGHWIKALKPVRGSLLGPLGEVFRGTKLPESRTVAALVLADYARDNPDLLAELILDADPKQYATLKPVLETHRARAIERMRRELAVSGHEWKDEPLKAAWTEPAAELKQEIENAGGLIAERFALCQTLPLERLSAVADGLRSSGYRPVRVRPWTRGDAVRVAVVWARDGRDWKLETDLGADEVKAREEPMRMDGFLPADVAGYRSGEQERFAVVWVKAEAGEEARLAVGVPAAKYPTQTDAFKKAGFVALTVQAVTSPDGGNRLSGVWWKGPRVPAAGNDLASDDQDEFAARVKVGEPLLVDADVTAPPPALPPLTERWRQQLAQAQQDVTANPTNLTMKFQRGMAYLRLKEDAKALVDLDEFIAKGQPSTAYRYRAELYIRAGRFEDARRDLAEFLKRPMPDAAKASGEAIVGVLLGDDAALTKLDAILKEHEKDAAFAYQGACAYARAAETTRIRLPARAAAMVGLADPWGLLTVPLAASLPEPSALADRAAALLRQAVQADVKTLDQMLLDADLESLRSHPGVHALLIEHGRNRRFATVWQGRTDREATAVHGLGLEEQLTRCRELAAQGWRPVGMSVTTVQGGSVLAASAWQRPVLTLAEREPLARQQAQAGVTLLHLGDAEPVWSMLIHTSQPEARSQLLWRMGQHKVDPRLLVRRLEEEKDDSARRALIVGLGEFTAAELPEDLRGPLTAKLLQWYREDPDPGVHGAIDWLLRHAKEGPNDRPLDWGQAKELEKIDEQLKRRDPDGVRRWYVNQQGQTMVLLPGPHEFRRGSPVGEPGRAGNERLHLSRIERNFAVATKLVTVAQWQRFLKDRPNLPTDYSTEYSPGADYPMNATWWFGAAMYCNWLSEQEGIPETEWCYPKQIGNGMRPHPDYLRRKGYRMLTEAEWECACRAGAGTSRYYGSSLELLPRYGWFLGNSPDQMRPVGQKRPNDFGLFDMHGNAWTWVQDLYNPYPPLSLIADKEDIRDINSNDSRVLRGGSFSDQPRFVRSAQRDGNRPVIRVSHLSGLRVARTYD